MSEGNKNETAIKMKTATLKPPETHFNVEIVFK